MFEKFVRINAETFRQRYEGTFGFFRDEKKQRLLVQISKITDDQCHFVSANGGTYHVNADHVNDVGFEFTPPKSMFYNGDKGAWLVRRIAAHQFQRGITPRNVKISTLGVGGKWAAKAVDFTSLDTLFMKSASPRVALLEWDKRSSVAFSPQFAVCTVSKELFLWENKIGTCSKEGDKFTVALDEPNLWRTEITDAIKRLDYTVEVI